MVTELASSLESSVPELATRSGRLVTELAARLGSYLFTDLASSLVISLVTEFASKLSTWLCCSSPLMFSCFLAGGCIVMFVNMVVLAENSQVS